MPCPSLPLLLSYNRSPSPQVYPPHRRAWVLRHELSHYIIHYASHIHRTSSLADYLQEGLAEFLALVTTLQAGGDASDFLAGYLHMLAVDEGIFESRMLQQPAIIDEEEGLDIKYRKAPYALLYMFMRGDDFGTVGDFVDHIFRARAIRMVRY